MAGSPEGGKEGCARRLHRGGSSRGAGLPEGGREGGARQLQFGCSAFAFVLLENEGFGCMTLFLSVTQSLE